MGSSDIILFTGVDFISLLKIFETSDFLTHSCFI